MLLLAVKIMIDGRIVPFLPWCLIGVGDWLVVGWPPVVQDLLVQLVLLQGPVVSSTGLFVCIFCTLLLDYLCCEFHMKCHLL